MAPSVVLGDTMGSGGGDVKLRGQGFKRPACCAQGSQGAHAVGCHLGARVRLASHPGRSVTAAFGHAVSDVVLVRAQEQVCGVDTRAVIARVQDMLPKRDGTVHQQPCYPVRCGDLSTPAHVSIAVRAEQAYPWPAVVRATVLHTTPETLRVAAIPAITALARAEVPVCTHFRIVPLKHDAAVSAGESMHTRSITDSGAYFQSKA
jgi:hypothetical protein